MIIECYYCESKVDAKVLSEVVEHDESPFVTKIVFMQCPVCKNAIVGMQDKDERDTRGEWGAPPTRVWPKPDKQLSWKLPTIVKNALEESHKCFKAGAYRACAVMCGRCLEGICVEFTKETNLSDGLKALLEKQIIDKRIYEWSEVLRQQRNLGAHATEHDIRREDAKDLLDFTSAICDYIYYLTAKFEEFKKRQVNKQKAVKPADVEPF